MATRKMPIWRLAWRNIWRNKRRTILTISAISLYGLLFLWFIWLCYGSQEGMIDNYVRIVSGHVQIHAQGFNDDMSVMKRIKEPQSILQAIQKEEHVVSYSTRIKTYGLVAANENSSGAFVMAVNPEQEKQVSNLYRTMKSGQYLDEDSQGEVVVGYVLAENLGIGIRDTIAVMVQASDGSMGARKFIVTGLVDPGIMTLNNSLLIMNLSDAQELLSYGEAVNEITMMVDDLANVGTVSESLKSQVDKSRIEVLTWDVVSPEMAMLNQITWAKFIVLMGVFAIVAALGVMNTILMSAMERVREFGIMMAMGVRPFQIVRLIITETFLITSLSVIIGFSLATTIGVLTMHEGISMNAFGAPEYMAQFGLGNAVLYTQVNWEGFIISLCVIMGMGLLASLYPAIRTGRMKPVQAIKFQ